MVVRVKWVLNKTRTYEIDATDLCARGGSLDFANELQAISRMFRRTGKGTYCLSMRSMLGGEPFTHESFLETLDELFLGYPVVCYNDVDTTLLLNARHALPTTYVGMQAQVDDPTSGSYPALLLNVIGGSDPADDAIEHPYDYYWFGSGISHILMNVFEPDEVICTQGVVSSTYVVPLTQFYFSGVIDHVVSQLSAPGHTRFIHAEKANLREDQAVDGRFLEDLLRMETPAELSLD